MVHDASISQRPDYLRDNTLGFGVGAFLTGVGVTVKKPSHYIRAVASFLTSGGGTARAPTGGRGVGTVSPASLRASGHTCATLTSVIRCSIHISGKVDPRYRATCHRVPAGANKTNSEKRPPMDEPCAVSISLDTEFGPGPQWLVRLSPRWGPYFTLTGPEPLHVTASMKDPPRLTGWTMVRVPEPLNTPATNSEPVGRRLKAMGCPQPSITRASPITVPTAMLGLERMRITADMSAGAQTDSNWRLREEGLVRVTKYVLYRQIGRG